MLRPVALWGRRPRGDTIELMSRPALLSDILQTLEAVAPTRNAEAWDNVGLLVGDPKQTVQKILLTIDLTAAVAREAEVEGCDLIVAYHPPIFEPLKRVTAGSVVFDLMRRGAAVYSPHTALDVADGGTNDMLADAIGLTDRRPLRAATKAAHYKLVTFAPSQAVESLSRALFDAGAGRIGKYSSCSFRSSGVGTFFGEEGTDPAIGQSGQLEQVDEVRLETVVPIASLPRVLDALRSAHPYEEPAFDLVQLAAAPGGAGQGRIGVMSPGAARGELLARIKRELQIDHLLVAGPTEGLVHTAAVCAGACGDHLNDAIAQKADLYLTGEMRHHDALKAAAAGLTVVCTLHSNSERAVLRRLRARLSQDFPGVATMLSQADRDPFAVH